MIVVFNPAAGGRRAGRLWRVLDVLSAAGVRIQLSETRRRGHARELAARAAESGVPMVVAAGGDGTIAEVANGIAGSAAALGVIPLGTANVLALEYRLPFGPRDVAAALSFRRTAPLLPGIARFAAPGAPDRVFVQMLGAGYDAQVVHNLSLPLKRLIGRSAYVCQTLRELPRYGFPPIRLRLDGVAAEAASVIVTKGRLYAGRYVVAPDAAPGEAGFRVVLFEHAGILPTLMYGALLPLGLMSRAPGVRIVPARRIEILSEDIPLQADGDPAGFGPVTVEDAEMPISLVVR